MSREAWKLGWGLALTALVALGQDVEPGGGPEAARASPGAEEERTRAALQESVRALRGLVREMERENARLKAENQVLAQRLDQITERLAAMTRTAADIERERNELVQMLREREDRVQELERKLAEVTNRLARLPERNEVSLAADRRELVAALERRTQECLELRAQLAALRRGETPRESTGESTLAHEDRIRELTRQFEEERKTLRTTISIIEEQRAELERRCAELRRDNERLLKALRARTFEAFPSGEAADTNAVLTP